jgi:hypothetical protein
MKLKIGQLVCVELLDHARGSSEPYAFSVYGRLARLDDEVVCVDSWGFTDKSRPHDPDNVDRYAIVRSAVKRIIPLQELGRTQ